MKDKKFCPLKLQKFNYCDEEKCACWDYFSGQCAIAAIATYLRHGFKITE